MIIKKNILIWYWGRHGFAQKYTNQIIKAHQGEIFVESEENVGTTFTIKIPLQ